MERKWMDLVLERLNRRNAVLFRAQDPLLRPLAEALGQASRLAVARWALEAVKEPAARLEALTGSDIPGRTLAAARCWAAGEITMPAAKREILLCHHLAAEMQDPEAVALCHAVGQACSVIHTPRHGMGLPVYELTALVRRYGLPEGAEAVEERVEAYARLLARPAGGGRAGGKNGQRSYCAEGGKRLGWFWWILGRRVPSLLRGGAAAGRKDGLCGGPGGGRGALHPVGDPGCCGFPGNPVLGWISGIGVLGIVILIFLEAGILLRARRLSAPAGKPDYTVVLGCGLRNGETVSRTMLERLEKARAVWQGEPLILSGGQSEREKYPEAEVMARWLMEKGIPPKKLMQEGRSRNTVQTCGLPGISSKRMPGGRWDSCGCGLSPTASTPRGRSRSPGCWGIRKPGRSRPDRRG